MRKVNFRLGELFCGPGGLACGSKMAGTIKHDGVEYSIQHAWATDYDLATCKTYGLNICGDENASSVVHADIRKLDLHRLKKISNLNIILQQYQKLLI